MYFFSRNLNENLIFRDENENIFLSISCFETRTRNRNSFLEVEREKMKLILTGIPGNGNSRHSLYWLYDDSLLTYSNCFWFLLTFLDFYWLLMTSNDSLLTPSLFLLTSTDSVLTSMALLWLSNDSLLTSTDSILTFYWLYTDALLNLCWLLLVFRVTRLTRLAKGLLLPRVWKYDLLRDASTSKNMFSGLGTCEFEFLEAIPKELDWARAIVHVQWSFAIFARARWLAESRCHKLRGIVTSWLDPEFYPQSAYVEIFATFAPKTP